MKNLRIAHRITLLSFFIILLFSFATGLVYTHLKDSLYKDKKNAIQQLVSITSGTVNYYLTQQNKGLLTQDQAQTAAIDAVRAARFDSGNYFFITDTQNRMILNPLQPELEGQNLTLLLDSDGRPPIQEITRIATTQGEGFISYKWTKPGGKTPVSKISFVQQIPAWGWIVGAGVYQDDIQAELTEALVMDIIIIGFASIISLLFVFSLSLSITRPLSATVRMIKSLQTGDLNQRLHLDQRDEIGQMARALDDFADNMRDEIIAAFNCLAKGDLTFEAQGIIREPLARTNVSLKKLNDEKEALALQLFQAQKLESIGRLASGIAHDFNNMLAIISGNIELALRKQAMGKSADKYLRQIKDTTERSAELTRHLLGFARKQTTTPKIISINNGIADILKLLGRIIGEEIILNWKPSHDDLKLLIDPSQLSQILTNLVINARDAIGQKGTIALGVESIDLDEAACQAYPTCKSGRYIQLSVSDDGCGMSKETQQQIFEPFFTTKAIDKGTGLGLSMVYGIVNQNNGFIKVASEPGQGTTFHIFFPQTVHDLTEKTTIEVKAPARGHETLLVVEDEVILLQLCEQILTESGYQVIASSDPVEALKLAQNHDKPIDLLLTDVVMPKLNGKELSERLRARQPETKVLFMSAYTADIIATRGLIDEGISLLEKPFTTEMLTRRVREILDSRPK